MISSSPHYRRLPMIALLALCLSGSAAPAWAQIGNAIDRIASRLSLTRADSTGVIADEAQTGEEVSNAWPSPNLEIHESLSPSTVLSESPALLRLLGEDPVFVYDPSGHRDPMLIPWTRSRVMYSELSSIAEQAIADRNWNLAQMAYRRMMEDLDSPEHQAAAEAGLLRVEMLLAEESEVRLETMGMARVVKLPPWIENNTSGVVYAGADSLCLVGTYTLRVGDVVPRQPVEVYVAKIEPSAVHFRIEDQIFVVPIKEGE